LIECAAVGGAGNGYAEGADRQTGRDRRAGV